jgi:hypothetical protein
MNNALLKETELSKSAKENALITDLDCLYQIADFTNVEPEAKERIEGSFKEIKNFLENYQIFLENFDIDK